MICNATETYKTIDVAPVWSAHPVGFALQTHKGHQFIAFYDADRVMTVGDRKLPDTTWEFVKLPQKTKWDSHNYIAMTIDDDDCLHISGNMHCAPLVYFRSERPMDIKSLKQLEHMTGEREARCTYPAFMRGPNKELIFTYRDGNSGNGCQLYNVYDHASKTWKRLLDTPLTDGKGVSNAYIDGPVKGPDGFFHMAWVWRDTGDCRMNHDLSYARSRDLKHWETSTGTAVKLPMTIETCEIVDPVPVKAGLINGDVVLGFDSQKRTIISYHKYDENGKSQIYQARLEDGKWKITQTTRWDYRWPFEGYGSIDFEVKLKRLSVKGPGKLAQEYTYPGHDGLYFLNEDTLQILGREDLPTSTPVEQLQQVRSEFPGMRARLASDAGGDQKDGRYMLRWETLAPHNDKPLTGTLPKATMLQVVQLPK